MYDIEIYIPVLLKFQDDKVVFTRNELNHINTIADRYFIKNAEYLSGEYDHFEYNLWEQGQTDTRASQEDKDKLTRVQADLDSLKSQIIAACRIAETPDPKAPPKKKKKNDKKPKAAPKPPKDEFSDAHTEIYWYHHRVIFRYIFRFREKCKIAPRKVRGIVWEHYRALLKIMIDEFNQSIGAAENGIRPEGRILSYYSYGMMICNGKKYGPEHISDKLGSLMFNIFQSAKPTLWHTKKQYMVRISIPGIMIYADENIGHDLKVDLINAIYQCCLYGEKIDDTNNKCVFSDNLAENIEQYNVIGENELTKLWEHFLNSLGGKTSDNQIHALERKSLKYAAGAFIIAILSLIVAALAPLLQ